MKMPHCSTTLLSHPQLHTLAHGPHPPGIHRAVAVEVAGEHHADIIFDDDADEQDVADLVEHVCALLTDRRRYLSRALAHSGSALDA